MGIPVYTNNASFHNADSVTSLTPSLPDGRTTNNVMIAYVFVDATGKTFSVGGAWTIGDSVNTGNVSSAWAWSLVDGAEVAPTFSWTGSANGISGIYMFSGNAVPTPTGAFVNQSADSSSTVTTTTLTSTADNSLLVDFLLFSGNQLQPAALNRTLISHVAVDEGSGVIDSGPINISGSVTDTTSISITTADWIAFSIEILGTGAGTAAAEKSTQIVAGSLETYSTPILTSRTSQDSAQVLETYVDPILGARATQICVTVLRSIGIGPPPTGPTGPPIIEPSLCVICDDNADYTTLPPWLYNFKQITRG